MKYSIAIIAIYFILLMLAIYLIATYSCEKRGYILGHWGTKIDCSSKYNYIFSYFIKFLVIFLFLFIYYRK